MTECRGECGTKSTCERERLCLLRLWVLGKMLYKIYMLQKLCARFRGWEI
jgi:hypothetical protein